MRWTVSFAASSFTSAHSTFASSRANRTAAAFPLPQPGPTDPAPTTSAILFCKRATMASSKVIGKLRQRSLSQWFSTAVCGYRFCLQACKASRVENDERGCPCFSEREFPQEPGALGCGSGQEGGVLTAEDKAGTQIDISRHQRLIVNPGHAGEFPVLARGRHHC